MAAYDGLCLDLSGTGCGLRSGCSCCAGEKGSLVLALAACFLSALNNRLRTGADKGNPTV